MTEPATTANAILAAAFWDLELSELLKFISELISAVAWPLVTYLVFRLFKDELVKLIPFLSKISALGVEAEFNRQLDKVEAVADAIAESPVAETENKPQAAKEPQDDEPGPATPPIDRDITRPVDEPSVSDPVALRANPTGTVMVAWQALDNALRLFADSALPLPGAARQFVHKRLILDMQKAGLLSEEEVESLLSLLALRNLAAHSSGTTISDTEAKRFNEIASKLARKYRNKAVMRRLEDGVAKAVDMMF